MPDWTRVFNDWPNDCAIETHQITGRRSGTFQLSHMFLTFLETRIIDLHFDADILSLSSFYIFPAGSVKRLFFAKVRFRRLKSSKDIDFGTNQKYVCDVLSIQLGPTLHHFRDIAGFCTWLHPYSTLILAVAVGADCRLPMLGSASGSARAEIVS